MQLIFGWSTPAHDHDCINIHFAHAPAGHARDHGLGIFDLSHHMSARVLNEFLLVGCSQLRSDIASAQARVRHTREMLSRPHYKTWRADLARQVEDGVFYTDESIVKWREGCSFSVMAEAAGRYDASHSNEEMERDCSSRARCSAFLALRDQRDDLQIEAMIKCGHPLLHPENGDWENISSLAGKEPGPRDAVIFDILAENKVQPHAWPSPDIPDDFAGASMFRSIHNDYLLALDFGSAEISQEADHAVDLSPQNMNIWSAYCTEVACEKELRTRLHLPSVNDAGDARVDIIHVLPLISQVVENARAMQSDIGSRLSLDSLLAACLCRANDVALGPHIRSARSIPHPRSLLFDDGLEERWAQRRPDVLRAYQDCADGTSTLRWRYSSNPGTGSAGPGWLHKSKVTLARSLDEEYKRRMYRTMGWYAQHIGPLRDVRIEARILDTQPSDTCDTVVFVSVAGICETDAMDEKAIERLQDLCIIGRYTPGPPSHCPHDSHEESARATAVGVYLVKDQVLAEVRHMTASTGEGQGRSSHPISAQPPLSVRAESSSVGLLDAEMSQEGHNNTSQGNMDTTASAKGLTRIQLPSFWLEDRSRHGSFIEAFGHACLRLQSSVRFYAALGVYDLVVFAIATDGYCAHLLCGWGTRPSGDVNHTDVVTNIADVNCPVWDLRDYSQAIRFCAFVLQLRHLHTRKICEAFEAQRADLTRDWKADPTAPRFQWTLKHQQADPATSAIRADREVQFQRFRDLQTEIGDIEQAMEDMETAVNLEDLEEAWPGPPLPESMILSWEHDSDSY